VRGGVTVVADAGPSGGFRMRPLSVGDILDETLVIYKRQFVAFITLTGVVVVPTALLTLVMLGLLSLVSGSLDSGAVTPEAGIMLGVGAVAFTLPVTLVTLIGRLLAGVVAVKVSADILLGRPVDIWESYRLAIKRLGPLTLAGLLVSIVTGAAGLCFPVAIFFALSWGLIIPVIVLENPGGVEAMRRSWNLMRGRRWQLLVCTMVIGVIASILVGIPVALFAMVAGVWMAVSASSLTTPGGPLVIQVGQVVFQALGETLFLAIGYIIMTRFYFDARVRKEAFDLELRLDQRLAAAPVTVSAPATSP
jgi:hypothetical protein